MARLNPRVFFDIDQENKRLGRIVFELFANEVPKTAENFRSLCTGERGLGKTTGVPLHYKGTIFHRIIKGFMAQGGDFSKANGTGGESIYGGIFQDESLVRRHDSGGLLSMANRGPNTNGSQFFITFRAAPHLDGKHVVFGRVVSGMEVLGMMEVLKTNEQDRPFTRVCIAHCGELVLKVAVVAQPSAPDSSAVVASGKRESSAAPEEAGEDRKKKRSKHDSDQEENDNSESSSESESDSDSDSDSESDSDSDSEEEKRKKKKRSSKKKSSKSSKKRSKKEKKIKKEKKRRSSRRHEEDDEEEEQEHDKEVTRKEDAPAREREIVQSDATGDHKDRQHQESTRDRDGGWRSSKFGSRRDDYYNRGGAHGAGEDRRRRDDERGRDRDGDQHEERGREREREREADRDRDDEHQQRPRDADGKIDQPEKKDDGDDNQKKDDARRKSFDWSRVRATDRDRDRNGDRDEEDRGRSRSPQRRYKGRGSMRYRTPPGLRN